MIGNGNSPEAQGQADSPLPLRGVRVLELGHIVAAPLAGMILADLGAEVVKVEPLHGDQSRGSPDQGSVFYSLNRNKVSLSIDLKKEKGLEALLRLTETADIVLDNHAPGALDRLGVGYEVLAGRNPRIIFCAIRGFLPGPYGDRPLLDELAQMLGGLAYMTGPPGQPLRAGASVVDIGSGMMAVIGILGALIARATSGRGQKIDVGLFETVAFWLSIQVTEAGLTGGVPLPMPMRGMGARLGFGVYRLFKTREQRLVFIAITSDAHWERFCREFQLDDLWGDETLQTGPGRIDHHERLNARIAELVATYDAGELLERLARSAIPHAPVNTPADLLEDRHIRETGALLQVPVAEGRAPIGVPAVPLRSSEYSWAVRIPPPGLGEHSTLVLRELGLADDEIESLVNTGILRDHGPTLFGFDAVPPSSTAGAPGSASTS